MKTTNKVNIAILIAISIIAGLACSGGGNQQEEANKLVDQANKKLDDTKELYAKTDDRNTKLFGVKIQTKGQLQAYKVIAAPEAKEIVADFEKVSDALKEISKQYDDVSRMNLNEKYKDYAKLKSDEFAKRADAVNIRKGNAQAFVEIDDPSTMVSKFDENNAKSDRLFKDAEDVATKAKKIEEDNKAVFAGK